MKLPKTILPAILILFLLASCSAEKPLTVDFEQADAEKIFSAALNDKTCLCTDAVMEFRFKDDIVSGCQVTLTYGSADDATAAAEWWNYHTGIKNAVADDTSVTYDYVIDPDNMESSLFSGMSSAQVISEVTRFNGTVRADS